MRRSPATSVCESRALIASRPPSHSSSSIAPPFLSLAVLLPLLFFTPLSKIFFISTCASTQMEWLPPLRRGAAETGGGSQREKRGGRPRGQMHRAKESHGEMERHLMFSRWGSQECRSNLQSAHSHTRAVAQLEGEHMGNLRPPKQRKLTQQDIGFCFLCKCHTVFLNK